MAAAPKGLRPFFNHATEMNVSAFNEFFRWGSGSWANDAGELKRAGLFDDEGLYFGEWNGRVIRSSHDGGACTYGGAGTGKLRDVLAYNLCGMRDTRSGRWYAPPRMIVNDPRGELAAISIHNQIRFGKAAYCINPYGLHGLPKHSVNPWDIIRPETPTFHADVKLCVADLMPLSGSANSEYFELRARDWSEAIIKAYLCSAS
jgi:type IV secretion system protein VirD4